MEVSFVYGGERISPSTDSIGNLTLAVRSTDLDALEQATSPAEAARAGLQWLGRLVRADAGHAYLLNRDATQYRLVGSLQPESWGALAPEVRPILTIDAAELPPEPALSTQGSERWLSVPCGAYLALRLRVRLQPVAADLMAQVVAAARSIGLVATLTYRLERAQLDASRLKATTAAARTVAETLVRPNRSLELLFRMPLRLLGTADGGLIVHESAEGGPTLAAAAGRGALLAVRILGGGIPALNRFPILPDLTTGESLGDLYGLGVRAVIRIPARWPESGTPALACAYYFLTHLPDMVEHQLASLADLGAHLAMVLADRAAMDRAKERYIATLKGVVAVTDGASPYSAGHSERIASYARLAARQLGLSPAEVEAVSLAAHLHDIGMSTLEFDPQQKEGALSTAEYEALQEHTSIGAELVSPIRDALPLAPMIAHHHERWDGRGYPHGLKGSEIPLGARIIAVCDLFEAKTTGRAYRSPLPFARAVADLQVAAGTQLDPAVVAAFVRGLESLRRQAAPGRPPAPCWELRQIPEAICGQCPNRKPEALPCWENPLALCSRHGSSCPTCLVYTEALTRGAGN